MQQQRFIDKSNLVRHVSGNNSAHHQEPILHIIRYQITNWQRIGYNIPQAVLHSLKLLMMGRIVARNMSN
jgi:hypothetical protein